MQFFHISLTIESCHLASAPILGIYHTLLPFIVDLASILICLKQHISLDYFELSQPILLEYVLVKAWASRMN